MKLAGMKISLPRFSARVRRWICVLATLGIFAVLAVGAFGVFRLGETLLVPARRIPGDWQNAVLDEPARHGVVIERFSTFGEDGVSIRALLVRPSVRPGTSIRFCEMRRRLGQNFALSGDAEGSGNHAPVRGTVFLLHGRSGIMED